MIIFENSENLRWNVLSIGMLSVHSFSKSNTLILLFRSLITIACSSFASCFRSKGSEDPSQPGFKILPAIFLLISARLIWLLLSSFSSTSLTLLKATFRPWRSSQSILVHCGWLSTVASIVSFGRSFVFWSINFIAFLVISIVLLSLLTMRRRDFLY